MERYILPYIKQYKNIDDLLESTDKSNMTCVTNMSSFLDTITTVPLKWTNRSLN